MNGAKSKGPTSAEGKAASSQNALRHGLCAKGLLVPGEDVAEYQAFVADFLRELHAVGTVQTMLAERAAQMAWKLKRIPVIEAAALETSRKSRGEADWGLGGMGDLIGELLADDDIVMQRLVRYETRIERSMRACLRELRVLQGGPERDRLWERGRPARSVAEEGGRAGRAPSGGKGGHSTGQAGRGFVPQSPDLGFVRPDGVPDCGAGVPPARGRDGRITDVEAEDTTFAKAVFPAATLGSFGKVDAEHLASIAG